MCACEVHTLLARDDLFCRRSLNNANFSADFVLKIPLVFWVFEIYCELKISWCVCFVFLCVFDSVRDFF